MAKIIVVIVLLFVAGCVSVEFPTPYGTAKYNRFGDQKVNGLILETDPNGGIVVNFEAQQSEARIFQDILTIISDAYKAGAATR